MGSVSETERGRVTSPFTTSLGTFWNADYLDVIGDIPDQSVDMVLIDPPFGCTALEWDVRPCLDTMWKQIKRVAKPNAAILIFGDMKFIIDVIAANRKDFRYDLVYEKERPVGFLNANVAPLRAHELIAVFYENKPKYDKSALGNKGRYKGRYCTKGQNTSLYGDIRGVAGVVNEKRCNKSVLNVAYNDVERKSSTHPTQKPQELIQGLVRMYTEAGDTVLDFFAGSCSVGYACESLGRKWLCVEKNKEYFDKAVSRIQREILDAPRLPLSSPAKVSESPLVAMV